MSGVLEAYSHVEEIVKGFKDKEALFFLQT
jgi:hypothetical protein